MGGTEATGLSTLTGIDTFTDDGISVTLTDFVLLSLEVFCKNSLTFMSETRQCLQGFLNFLSLRDLAERLDLEFLMSKVSPQSVTI